MFRATMICGVAAFAMSSPALAITATIDFETDSFATPLVNGQDISGTEVSVLFNISSSGSNLGAAIFDSDSGGPNDFVGAPDLDLIVDSGNILMLQSNTAPTQTVPGIFDVPNDDVNGGIIDFVFTITDVTMTSVDLVDINGNGAVTITLTDTSARTRTYLVPDEWTGDPEASEPGIGTLLLTTLADQAGPNGPIATASEIAGFDAANVVSISFDFNGSGGLDNLIFESPFVPAPGAAALLAVGMMGVARRRRA